MIPMRGCARAFAEASDCLRVNRADDSSDNHNDTLGKGCSRNCVHGRFPL